MSSLLLPQTQETFKRYETTITSGISLTASGTLINTIAGSRAILLSVTLDPSIPNYNLRCRITINTISGGSYTISDYNYDASTGDFNNFSSSVLDSANKYVLEAGDLVTVDLSSNSGGFYDQNFVVTASVLEIFDLPEEKTAVTEISFLENWDFKNLSYLVDTGNITSVYSYIDYTLVGTSNGLLLKSEDLKNWSIIPLSPSFSNQIIDEIKVIKFNDGAEKIIVGSSQGKLTIANSNDTAVWTDINLSSIFESNTITSISYSPSLDLVIAIGGNKIATSTDGLTWSEWTGIFGSTNSVRASLYAGNSVFIGGDSGNISRSFDGTTWIPLVTNQSFNIKDMAFNNITGNILVVGTNSSAAIANINNLNNWTYINLSSIFSSGSINSVEYHDGTFIVAGDGSKAAVSTDEGDSWTVLDLTNLPQRSINKIRRIGDFYALVGDFGLFATSSDLFAWTNRSTALSGGVSNDFYDITNSDSVIVIVGESGFTAYSDSVSATAIWTLAFSNFGDFNIYSVYYAPDNTNTDRFISVGQNGRMVVSTNGSSWGYIDISNSTTQDLFTGIYSPETTNIVGGFSGVLIKNDGNTSSGGDWSDLPPNEIFNNSYNLLDSIWAFNLFIVVGYSNDGVLIATSEDGITWTEHNVKGLFGTDLVKSKVRAIAYNGQRVAIISDIGSVGYSSDGIYWFSNDISDVLEGQEVYSLVSFAGNFYAGGTNGIILRSTDGINWSRIEPTSYGVTDKKAIVLEGDSSLGTRLIFGNSVSNLFYLGSGLNFKQLFSPINSYTPIYTSGETLRNSPIFYSGSNARPYLFLGSVSGNAYDGISIDNFGNIREEFTIYNLASNPLDLAGRIAYSPNSGYFFQGFGSNTSIAYMDYGRFIELGGSYSSYMYLRSGSYDWLLNDNTYKSYIFRGVTYIKNRFYASLAAGTGFSFSDPPQSTLSSSYRDTLPNPLFPNSRTENSIEPNQKLFSAGDYIFAQTIGSTYQAFTALLLNANGGIVSSSTSISTPGIIRDVSFLNGVYIIINSLGEVYESTDPVNGLTQVTEIEGAISISTNSEIGYSIILTGDDTYYFKFGGIAAWTISSLNDENATLTNVASSPAGSFLLNTGFIISTVSPANYIYNIEG